ncbi:hypothetical protein F2981_33595 (plasmid) [Sinorhizobium meliloti]|nr:hypothetical protein [Sinorhizobium meliloti]
MENPRQRIDRQLRLPFDKLYRNQQFRGAGLTVLRKGSRDAFCSRSPPPSSDRGFAGLASRRFQAIPAAFFMSTTRQRMFSDHDSIYIRSLGEDYKAISLLLRFLSSRFSPDSLALIAEEADIRQYRR